MTFVSATRLSLHQGESHPRSTTATFFGVFWQLNQKNDAGLEKGVFPGANRAQLIGSL
jgi:hypothetical protein